MSHMYNILNMLYHISKASCDSRSRIDIIKIRPLDMIIIVKYRNVTKFKIFGNVWVSIDSVNHIFNVFTFISHISIEANCCGTTI